MAKLSANSGDPDQMPCSAASDLGLHCFPITLLWISRLQWVKELITTTADNNLKHVFLISKKISLDISCELSVKQIIHLKCQDLFSVKNNKKNYKNVVCY